MRKRRGYKKTVKTKTVVFCIPGKVFSDEFLVSWTRLYDWCISNNITPILSNNYDPVVYYARNKVLGGNTRKGINQKPFQGKVKYDYIMWIDSDMVFEPSDFETLLQMNTDIASGIYKMQGGKEYATVVEMRDQDYINEGRYVFLTDNQLSKLSNSFEVDYTGFGWILFKKGVLENLEYPWFKPHWFDYGNNIKEFTSEDVGICKSLREKGYSIIVNKSLIIGHEKSCILK